MTIEELDFENKYCEQVPQYLKSYEKFYKFMKLFSNYILQIGNELNKILPMLNVNSSKGDILKKISQKLNIEIEKRNTGNTEEDLLNYDNDLKTAILGLQIKRLSFGTRIDLKETILSLFPVLISENSSVKIIDNQDMTVDMTIVGYSTDLTSKIIEDYILPRVTGVKFNLSYLNFGKNLFALDKAEFIVKDENNEPIKALDSDGNETDKYVLFTTTDYKNFTAIPDTTSNYYYKGQKIKAGYYGNVGFGKNSNDTNGGLWQTFIRI